MSSFFLLTQVTSTRLSALSAMGNAQFFLFLRFFSFRVTHRQLTGAQRRRMVGRGHRAGRSSTAGGIGARSGGRAEVRNSGPVRRPNEARTRDGAGGGSVGEGEGGGSRAVLTSRRVGRLLLSRLATRLRMAKDELPQVVHHHGRLARVGRLQREPPGPWAGGRGRRRSGAPPRALKV